MTSALTTEQIAELRTGHTVGDEYRLPETMSPRRMAWKRYWHHRGAAVSTILLSIVMIIVLATPLTARYGINEQVISIDEGNNVFLPPQQIAWFGTDDIGRDMYTRLLYGIRTSMFTSLMGSRALLTLLYGGRRKIAKLAIG